jgi:hypothetical protein
MSERLEPSLASALLPSGLGQAVTIRRAREEIKGTLSDAVLDEALVERGTLGQVHKGLIEAGILQELSHPRKYRRI